MERKDYYLILGVSRGENLRSIQAAFRELAKRYHPDRAGPQGTGTFQDIQEAYAVLSNPEKRKMYNHELEQDEIKTHSPPEPIFSRPLSRRWASGASIYVGVAWLWNIRPAFEPLFERFLRNFTGEGIPKGERLEALNVEVTLSPEEAARGVTVPVGVPVLYTCPECGGSGRDWLFPCIDCNAQGIIEEEQTVKVYIPRMAADRTVIEVPIYGLGIHNFYLSLYLWISRSAL